MDMKKRQIIEVSKLPNGKYVLCVISVAPRRMIYYHKQKEPHISHRWMQADDWSAFDSAIESFAFEVNYGDSIKKSVHLSPAVLLKMQSLTLTANQICQINPDVKDLKPNNIAIAVKCEIEYGEKMSSDIELKNVGKSTAIVSNELLVPAFKKSPKANINKKEQKKLSVLKPDEDLDQQIQSFHIGQQDLSCLTPITVPTANNTSTLNSASKLDELNISHSSKNGIGTRKSKGAKLLCSEKFIEELIASTPARQRRTISKPKRFDEFVMQPKRQSSSPKSYLSDEEFSEGSTTPKRKRTFHLASKTSLTKVNKTPAAQKTIKETPHSCSRVLFQKKKNVNIEMLSRKNMLALMEDLSPPSAPQVEFLSLNDMTLDQIMSSFNDIKPRLDSLFKDVSHKNYVQSHGGISHFLVIGLISDKIKSEMMKKLGEIYERCELPKFGSHFINVLVPEWILSIFMERFNMTRDDAIEHIKAQNKQYFH